MERSSVFLRDFLRKNAHPSGVNTLEEPPSSLRSRNLEIQPQKEETEEMLLRHIPAQV